MYETFTFDYDWNSTFDAIISVNHRKIWEISWIVCFGPNKIVLRLCLGLKDSYHIKDQ